MTHGFGQPSAGISVGQDSSWNTLPEFGGRATWRFSSSSLRRAGLRGKTAKTTATSLQSEPVNIIVTGGAGFIGSHLVHSLLNRGDKVLVIDDFSTGIRENLPANQQLRVIDFRLGGSSPPVLSSNAFDAVVHLAGLPSVSASWENAIEAHDRNLTATVSLLALCREIKIPRFVFASSAAVYGLPDTLPIREDAVVSPSLSLWPSEAREREISEACLPKRAVSLASR